MIYTATLASPCELVLFTSSAQHRAENAGSAAAVVLSKPQYCADVALAFASTVLAVQCLTISTAWCGHSLWGSDKHLACNDQELSIHYHPPKPALLTSSADRHGASLVRKVFITLETKESSLQHPATKDSNTEK